MDIFQVDGGVLVDPGPLLDNCWSSIPFRRLQLGEQRSLHALLNLCRMGLRVSRQLQISVNCEETVFVLQALQREVKMRPHLRRLRALVPKVLLFEIDEELGNELDGGDEASWALGLGGVGFDH